MNPPVRYRPDLGTPEEGEAEAGRGSAGALREVMDVTLADEGHAVRSVHAKGHAYVQGTLEVLPGLPSELAQGLFAKPGAHGAILLVAEGQHVDIQAPRMGLNG